MKPSWQWRGKNRQRPNGAWPWLILKLAGAAALAWFLVRVLPKPSRASYPCQRAAFPVASGFVIWLCGLLAIHSGGKLLARQKLVAVGGIVAFAVAAVWTTLCLTGDDEAQTAAAPKQSDWNFVPAPPNQPVGVARGIFPGRVVWARDPQATRWAGHWQQKSDQWWLDDNTDQGRVDHLLASTLLRLTGQTNCPEAWRAIFEYSRKFHWIMQSEDNYQKGG